MKYIDLFAGIGGFHYGIDVAVAERNKQGIPQEDKNSTINDDRSMAVQQFTCVYSNEWDKYANSVYRRHYGECDNRDIRTVEAKEIPEFDLLTGGFPCQAFSIAGKRRGFDDTRGTLFFEIARILKEKQPRLCLLENVKGLLSHDNGRTFKIILATLVELGYDVEWQVLNSKNHGVPQNRERVFIVGDLRGEPRPEVFPITGTDGENGKVEVRPETKQQVSPTIGTPSGGHHIPSVRYPLKFMKRNQKNVDGGHSFTVDSVNTGGVKQGTRIRRLTPTECERLQGFPDGWTEGVSDTQRYKCLGNAVTVNVVYEVAKRLYV